MYFLWICLFYMFIFGVDRAWMVSNTVVTLLDKSFVSLVGVVLLSKLRRCILSIINTLDQDPNICAV